MIDPLIIRLIAIGFALLFFLAAWHKLNDRLEFRGILTAYKIMPNSLLAPAAMLMPVFEMLLAIGWLATAMLLRIEFLAVSTAALTVMLLTMYATAISINLVRGRTYIDCGCGFSTLAGSSKSASKSGVQQLSKGLVLRNLLLVIAALATALPVSEREFGMLDALSLAAGSCVLILLYAAFNQLLANRSAIGAWRNQPRKTSNA